MLKLTRKPGQSILIGDDIIIKVDEVQGKVVDLVISAPSNMTILREELAGKNGNKKEKKDRIN